ITAAGKIRNMRDRKSRSATCSPFVTITASRNLQEPQDRRKFCEASKPDQDVLAADKCSQRRNGKMTDEEAYQILGIKPGATAEEVARANRSLIKKKLHPDEGGFEYLAAQINRDDILGKCNASLAVDGDVSRG